MSATTLFALGLGDVAPIGRGGRLLVVAETGSSLMLLWMLFGALVGATIGLAKGELLPLICNAISGMIVLPFVG